MNNIHVAPANSWLRLSYLVSGDVPSIERKSLWMETGGTKKYDESNLEFQNETHEGRLILVGARERRESRWTLGCGG
jgi:hypothetical protein